MTLYLIGLGLGNEKDITVRGLEIVRKAKFVYLESYTSRLNCSHERLERFYFAENEKNINSFKKIILADRNLVENHADEILDKAKADDVAFLVVGDVFSATTHHDLRLRALKEGIKVEIINNVSIMTAVGVTGLDLYKFGRTTTVVFPEPNFFPETPYDVIKMNLANGLHTLCLLDIKVEFNAKGEKIREMYMDVNEALHLLMAIAEKRKDADEENENIINENTKVVGCARLGSENQLIKFGTVKELLNFNFGEPLHALIIPGKLHFMEEEVLEMYNL
ncbi:diphthine synthase [Candidatus Woesearchaeota archaeon]|nr:diphthine synthase [Candidatus Woesearchaeota archaeon]